MRETYAVKAKRSLQLADHLLIGTYPLVNDPKLLLGVLSNLEDYYSNVIIYALSEKIEPLRTKEARLEQFRHHFKTKISPEEIKHIQIVYDLVKEHKGASVEFVRKQKLVMCDNHYEFHALTPETLKMHLQNAKKIQKKLLG